jgi:NTP pyrophosphatase (non-canonical NTP hydrolase)
MIDLLVGENLEIRDMQAFHKALDAEKDFDLDMIRNIAYLVGELGEVVHAARQFQRVKGSVQERGAREHLGEELADCLAYLLKLANYAGLDLQSAYVKKMRRNLDRTWSKREHNNEHKLSAAETIDLKADG